MSEDYIARRQFLQESAAAITGVWLTAALGGAAGLSALSCAPAEHHSKWQTFTNAEAEDVAAIASLIIPSDVTPGAREAGVIDFIDRALSSFAREQRSLFATGLADLERRAAAARPRAKSFARLEPSQQTEILHQLEQSKSDFFTAMLAATAAGMFANPEYGGNRDKIGWKLIGFDDRFFWEAPFGYYDRDEASHA
ncbi:MAG TPA: gluconate 2-dehydrogenase subunit 3 family protein [Gemmatimonadaceae bacterium]|nr:gluconate 2-dehydrogenase subunit 3 family protein [Gemmatimonadaceae bacterium]